MSPRRIQRGPRRGVGLVELMISLAICSMLLVAVASAFVASSAAVETNETFFRATQTARIAMVQLQNTIRRSDELSVPSQIRIDVITWDGKDRSYVYDAAARQLKLITNESTTDPDYVLARNVSAVKFAADSEVYPGTSTSRVVRVTISLDVSIGREQVHLSGSVVPRRAVTY